MSDIGSRSRRSSRSQSTSENQRRMSVESSQRRVSIESNKSGTSTRRISVSRRFSASSFVSTFKKPTDTTERSQAKKNLLFENTYHLEPKSHFPEGKVRAVINEALDTLASHTYSATHSPFVAKLLSARLLESVKQLKIERYKVVCLVTIGSKESQGLRIASRCLWDVQFDTFVNVCFESQRFFAVGTVYGIYYE